MTSESFEPARDRILPDVLHTAVKSVENGTGLSVDRGFGMSKRQKALINLTCLFGGLGCWNVTCSYDSVHNSVAVICLFKSVSNGLCRKSFSSALLDSRQRLPRNLARTLVGRCSSQVVKTTAKMSY